MREATWTHCHVAAKLEVEEFILEFFLEPQITSWIQQSDNECIFYIHSNKFFYFNGKNIKKIFNIYGSCVSVSEENMSLEAFCHGGES